MALLAIAAILVGCGVPWSTPSAMEPTLTAIEKLGFDCDNGVKDNVPSGLYQWSCHATEGGVDVAVLVSGNDNGVSEIDDDYASTDPALVIAGFKRLLATVPPLRGAPALAAGLEGWAGPMTTTVVSGVRVTAECDVTQCLIEVMTAGDATGPLPFP